MSDKMKMRCTNVCFYPYPISSMVGTVMYLWTDEKSPTRPTLMYLILHIDPCILKYSVVEKKMVGSQLWSYQLGCLISVR